MKSSKLVSVVGLLMLSMQIWSPTNLAFAQTPTPTQTADRKLEAKLTDISMWVGPQDALTAAISVRNRGTEVVSDMQVALAIYQGIATRSHLERSFDGRLGEPVFSDTISVEGAVDPGSSTTITVTKPLAEIGFFKTADDRVYPVTLTVRSGRNSAQQIQTHMIFFTKTAPIPLSVALVLAPNPDPIYTPNGLITEAGVSRLVGEASAMETMLSALETHPEAHLTLAPSGLLLDSLADLSNGYTVATGGARSRRVEADGEAAVRSLRAVERLRTISGRDSVRFAVNTYSLASLPWLRHEGFTDRVAGQLDQTKRILGLTVGAQPLPGWVVPGDGVLDET
ncbi:MAG: hypothetical protein ACRD1T_11015, partial [Acidimicrobiia bacterium]